MITITIKTDNAAFEDQGRAFEIARILKTLAARLEQGYYLSPNLLDANGNTVGTFKATGKDGRL